ncbi:MAG: benzoate/H(+) symporter BenE family transporter, partial [Chloroflexi bacterium]|nr:benzoate/H(+) symporter BenE family transporter [Chloroflexota bacterium]
MRSWPFSLEPPTNPRANLVDLPRYVGPSTAGAALVAALIAFTGPVVLVLQAGTNAQLSPDQINSWIFAVAVGGGMASVVLSLLYRQPLCNAWSIAGAALLVGTLPRFSLAEAVGAYLVSGLLILLLAISGLFGAAMERVPQEIVMGMLAGVLLRFAIGIFTPIV